MLHDKKKCKEKVDMLRQMKAVMQAHETKTHKVISTKIQSQTKGKRNDHEETRNQEKQNDHLVVTCLRCPVELTYMSVQTHSLISSYMSPRTHFHQMLKNSLQMLARTALTWGHCDLDISSPKSNQFIPESKQRICANFKRIPRRSQISLSPGWEGLEVQTSNPKTQSLSSK